MISYIGGKYRMAKWINEYIPKSTIYAEVFGGAFWVYLRGNIKAPVIIYNDKNAHMANLIGCMRNPIMFHAALDIKPQNKRLFDTYQDNLNLEFTKQYTNGLLGFDEPSAVQYAYIATQVFSGSKPLESKFVDLKGKYRSKFLTMKDKLMKDKYQKKLTNISKVEALDYTDLILKYDSKETFFYVDPPYWKTENYYSNHDFDSEDHHTLIEHLKRTKARWALSYYDFPKLSEWLPKDKFTWIEREFPKAAGAKKGKKQSKGIEILIMNYKINEI
jgi:DNA adenine methylase